jgi:hypothetical protein
MHGQLDTLQIRYPDHASGNAPIDAVITWCDSSANEFQHGLAAAISKYISFFGHAPDNGAISRNRFEDIGLLTYCLRSIEKFVPFIRTLYLVTDERAPSWIDHRKVRIVRHEEIFNGQGVLPTFNSNSIEWNIDRITGLSDCFLYFNDDFIVTDTLALDDLFTIDGRIKIHYDDIFEFNHNTDDYYQRSLQKTLRLLDGDFGSRCDFFSIAHAPYLMSRNIVRYLRSRHSFSYLQTANNPIRSSLDTSIVQLFPAFLREIYSSYWARTDTGTPFIRVDGRTYQNIYFRVANFNFDKDIYLFRKYRPKYLCVNDGYCEHNRISDDENDYLKFRLSEFLNELFPDKSSYEISALPPMDCAENYALAAGDRIDLSSRNPRVCRYLYSGWSFPEEWGVWSEGGRAQIRIKISDPTRNSLLSLGQIRSYGEQRVTIFINGRHLGAFHFDQSPRSVWLPVNTDDITEDGALDIVFVTPDHNSRDGEDRSLGVGLSTLGFTAH